MLLEDIETSFKDFIKKTDIDNLYLLPKGVVPPNPSELLNSPKTKALIHVLSDKFDYVILDGTPKTFFITSRNIINGINNMRMNLNHNDSYS